MIETIIVGVIAVLLSFLYRNQGAKMALKFSFAIIAVFLSIRYDFGNDYANYLDIFNEVNEQKIDWLSLDSITATHAHAEVGWIILNYLCQPIGFFGLVIITSLIECYILYKFISEHVPNRWQWLALFIFIFTPNLMLTGATMMRQFLAMTICIYSLKYVFRNQFKAFMLCVLLAYSFHGTAFVFTLVYFVKYIPKLRIGKNNIIYFTIIYAIWCGVNLFFFNSILSRLQGASFLDKYSSAIGENNLTIGLGVVFYILMTMSVLNKLPEQEKRTQIICYSSVFSAFIIPLGVYSSLVGRLGLYFDIMGTVFYPVSFMRIKTTLFRNLIICSYMLFVLYLFYSFFHSEVWVEKFMEYKTIFSTTWQ